MEFLMNYLIDNTEYEWNNLNGAKKNLASLGFEVQEKNLPENHKSHLSVNDQKKIIIIRPTYINKKGKVKEYTTKAKINRLLGVCVYYYQNIAGKPIDQKSVSIYNADETVSGLAVFCSHLKNRDFEKKVLKEEKVYMKKKVNKSENNKK